MGLIAIPRLTKSSPDNMMRQALDYNRTLLCTEFTKTVSVVHDDGSTFFVKHSHVQIIEQEYLFVFGEHQSPMIFAIDDIIFKIK